MAARATDYDSPWKEALHHFLPDCLRLLAPRLYNMIDWDYAPVFLDKELQAIAPRSLNGRRYADKLVRLRTKQQCTLWLLLHVEFQGGRIRHASLLQFAARMYQYHNRIHDYYRSVGSDADQPISLTSLGMLIDSSSDNAHNGIDTTSVTHKYTDLSGTTSVQFVFPVVHLKNWLSRWDELEQHAKTNPFAAVIMAQLTASTTPKNDLSRPVKKSEIVRLLYQHNYPRETARQVLRLIDWLIDLPEALVPVFIERVTAIEQEYRMTYITSFERYAEKREKEKWLAKGMDKGLHIGQANLLQGQLTRKFGPLSDASLLHLKNATPSQLETWSLNLLDANTLDEVFAE